MHDDNTAPIIFLLQYRLLTIASLNNACLLFNYFLHFKCEFIQILKLYLNGKSEEILKVRSLHLQSISPLPEVQESSQPVPVIIATKPTNNYSFEPKFGSSGALSGELNHSAVIITNMVHPGHLYIQLVDQDLPLYYQMQMDLQEEFGSVTNKSPSYCPTPANGIISSFIS